MSDSNNSSTRANDEEIKIRIPATITLRDVITFVSIAVTLTLGWATFGTRLTVIEKELVSIAKNEDEKKQNLKEIQQRVNHLDDRLRDNENSVEDIWRNIRKPSGR